MSLKHYLFAFAFALNLASHSMLAAQESKAQKASGEVKTIRALLIAGGCCHDYANQQQALCKGIQARANVQVDVYWTDNSTTAPILPLYSKLNWADTYDVIIHDECGSDIKDPALLNRIVQTHEKIPAVHLHCAMHSFRTGSDVWFQHLGLQSSGHGPQEPIDIEFSKMKHPITETLENWTTIKEELYNNVKVFDAQPLAIGKQKVGSGGNARVDEAIVVWTNEKSGARSFSTSLGHNTETVADPRYLELVTRGLLWSCDKLTPEYLVPYQGENKVTFVDKNRLSANGEAEMGKMPQGATLAKVTASSTQSGNGRSNILDGKIETRWCADGSAYPAWVQLELEKSRAVSAIQIDWESLRGVYQYRVEGSVDGKSFSTLIDRSKNTESQVGKEPFSSPSELKFIRVTGLGSRAGWCSIREVRLFEKDAIILWPADEKSEPGVFKPASAEAFSKSGNTIPRIEKLTAEQESEILKDVKVAEGFEATVFAAPPAVNYPVFVAASVDGTLYVSSDGNGSLGRDPLRGRIIRLRDTDNDGRADETKVFCEVDAPRGLLWDNDRLFVMHPPHLSAFIDHDRDGIADEQKILVRNLAFDYDQRPADHTTNGLSLGVDGWLYIAGGDFGFMDATGTDGRRLTHRGGGVIRVRPDGSGLEVYSTGTRNILEVAISPEMEMFARDNTNDGGGWDVRLHHFTGNDDHGYPRLYKNFPGECVAPLADYGGGSGCGAVYIDEPGFGKWNHAPFTADWGTGAIYHHEVRPIGSTYQEVSAPKPFLQMTRPTDADVDGNSRVYAASWKGATFNWNGPDVGYIVRVQPKGFKPTPMLDFSKADAESLVKELDSESSRRRMEASRELERRGDPRGQLLLKKGLDKRSHDRALLESLQTDASASEVLQALGSADPVVSHTAIRCVSSRNLIAPAIQALNDSKVDFEKLTRALAMSHEPKVVDAIIAKLKQETAPERRQALLTALCRLHFQEGKWKGDSWGTRPDTRGPYYQPDNWQESEKIAQALKEVLSNATASEVSFLIEAMGKNRIQTNEGLERIIELANVDSLAVPTAVAQLASLKEIPESGIALLTRTIGRNDTSSEVLAQAIVALAKVPNHEVLDPMLDALEKLSQRTDNSTNWNTAVDAFLSSSQLAAKAHQLVALSQKSESRLGEVFDSAILAIGNKNPGPEVLAVVQQAIQEAWTTKAAKIRMMQAAQRTQNHFIDEEILSAWRDADPEIAQVAANVAKTLKLKQRPIDTTPKVSSVTAEQAVEYLIKNDGDVSLGQRLFAKANCSQCHTVRQNEVQKGPYLGNIAKTYKRPELAVAVLDPSKTLAQGFVTNIILTHDDVTITGFVTDEQNDRVTLRDAQAKEHAILKEDIQSRKTSTTSSMPTGLMNDYTLFEFSSLLKYLESLSQ